MEIQSDKIRYRRATIDDIESLTSFRVRFLNELYGHPENNETEILRNLYENISIKPFRLMLSSLGWPNMMRKSPEQVGS